MWRLQTVEILINGAVILIVAAVALTAILFVVGETIEHFTP